MIEYQIVESDFSTNFALDKNTGILTLTKALDREAIDPELDGLITLNVTAYDKGIPPLGTWATVEVNVGVMILIFVYLLQLLEIFLSVYLCLPLPYCVCCFF